MTPRLRTYSEQRALDLDQIRALRHQFILRLLALLAAAGAAVLNLMRG